MPACVQQGDFGQKTEQGKAKVSILKERAGKPKSPQNVVTDLTPGLGEMCHFNKPMQSEHFLDAVRCLMMSPSVFDFWLICSHETLVAGIIIAFHFSIHAALDLLNKAGGRIGEVG